MASTRRVIQPSTTSFCLAGSRPVGHVQIRSALSSRAASSAPCRATDKQDAFTFGITAITGRWPAVVAASVPAAPAPAESAVVFNEWTSQTLVAATISEPADHRGAEDCCREFFISASSGSIQGNSFCFGAASEAAQRGCNQDGSSKYAAHLAEGSAARRNPFWQNGHQKGRTACPKPCRGLRKRTHRPKPRRRDGGQSVTPEPASDYFVWAARYAMIAAITGYKGRRGDRSARGGAARSTPTVAARRRWG